VPVTANFEPDPIPKNPVAGSAAALGAAGPIVTVATATKQANRIQCCLAAIRWSPQKLLRDQGLSRSGGAEHASP
jgi:hypothetical protein